MIKIQSKSMYDDTRSSIKNDLMDNIKYAVNIQSAILHSENRLRRFHPESFIIYRPQNFVSGDFYWMEKNSNKLTLVIGDSTGHGVSASFISLITLSALESLSHSKKVLTNPKYVLEYLNNHLYKILKKDRGSTLFESAEMAAVTFDFENNILEYCSAGITLVSCINGQSQKLEKDKKSIGSFSDDLFEINTYHHSLKPGEKIFLMSDGLKDQIGGEKDKKIGSQRLLEILTNTSCLPSIHQKNSIMGYLEFWKNKNEQTDDICLIGLTVPEKNK